MLLRSLFATSIAVALVGMGCGSGSPAPSRAEDSRLNLLVILMDDIGPEWLSCYGSESVKTPRIDELARGGARFKHCYATPLCSTTRSVFLTGRYQYRTGWVWHHDPAVYGGGYFDWDREMTFARALRQAGYRTALAGKWQINNLYEQPDALDKHGFDEHCVWPGGKRDSEDQSSRYWDAYVIENGKGAVRKGAFGPDIYSDYIIDFMRRNKERPFLAYYAMHLVHTPLVTTPHELDEKENPDTRIKSSLQYGAMVRYTDFLVGRILDELDELGLTERTVVLLAGDNGSPRSVTARDQRGEVQGGKGLITETGIDVPLMLSCPPLFPGQQVLELADFSDVFPTLLDLAGVSIPSGLQIDGHSLVPLLKKQPGAKGRDWAYTQYGPDRVIRDSRFKLYSSGSMFDVVQDPFEKKDLKGSQDSAVVASRTALGNVLESLPADAKLPWEPRSQSVSKAKESGEKP